MKIIDEIYPELTVPTELSQYSNPAETIFFDIETTGLNKASTSLYLIGCGYYNNGVLNTRFYFGESESDELNLLNSFFELVKHFKTVVHFNGTKFDLPYIEYKAQKYTIENPIKNMQSLDIYKLIKPLRYLIFRESMKQKCVEDFMGISREDMFNGGELIEVYHRYTKTLDSGDFSLLMLHNREDVLGMHKIFPILNFLKLSECTPTYKRHVINEYTDYNGILQRELIVEYTLDITLPRSFSVQNNAFYFKFCSENDLLSIRIPIKSGVMKHYYENYKDYVYLIKENRCVHKSVAESIDKSLKVKANKEMCCTLVQGEFIPTLGYSYSKACGTEYKLRNEYMYITDDFIESYNDFSINEYGKFLLNNLLDSKPKRKKQSPLQ